MPHEERIIRLATDERNRAVLTALNDAARPLSVEELAERIVACDTAVVEASIYEDELERVLLSLHHHHLPKLDEAGLIEYDIDEKRVTYSDYATVDAEWLEIEMIDELLARVTGPDGRDSETLGVIEGHEDIYAYGQRLAEQAEEELFLIYLDDDLLDEGCVPHAADAIDRGVECYAGTHDPDARDFFRTHLPEATLWEPQLDWTNAPTEYPRLGQLVFVDRETAMIGFMCEPEGGVARVDTAVIGDGADNPLVVLVRDLLGSRLDHLDYQSERFQTDLPFNP